MNGRGVRERERQGDKQREIRGGIETREGKERENRRRVTGDRKRQNL